MWEVWAGRSPMFSRSFLSMYISSSWRRQEGKHEDKVWSVCVCARVPVWRRHPPAGYWLSASPGSVGGPAPGLQSGSSTGFVGRRRWLKVRHNIIRLEWDAIAYVLIIFTHSCCTITWETNSTHSRMAVTDQTRLDRMGRDWVGYREFEDVTDGNVKLCWQIQNRQYDDTMHKIVLKTWCKATQHHKQTKTHRTSQKDPMWYNTMW